MTWIRWDTPTPRSEVIGFLADRLGIRPVYALGHYNALCCAFGEHRQDGRIDQVPDVRLESWAEWPGRAGKFAEAIREWCAKGDGDPGELRGWWRQKKLLDRQERDRQKPDGRKKSPAYPPQIPRGIPAGVVGATDGRTDGNGRTDGPAAGAIAGLVNRMQGEPDRHAVFEWFENLPRGVDPTPWAQRFGMWLEGMDRAGGRPCSVAALAKALRDYPLISDKSLSPVFVSRCVDRAERELAAAGKGTEESWTAKPPEAA